MSTTKKHLLRTLGYVCVILGLSAVSVAAYAGHIIPLSEPGTLFMVAVGFAVAGLAAVRKIRKK